MMVIHHRIEIPLDRDVTVGGLKEKLEQLRVPDKATVSFMVQQGDRPWDPTTTSMFVRWEE